MTTSSAVAALCTDLDTTDSMYATHPASVCLANNSSTFSSMPDLDSSVYSNISNDSHLDVNTPHAKMQLSNNSSNDTPPLSYTSSSKLDLSIKLQDQESVSVIPAVPDVTSPLTGVAVGTAMSDDDLPHTALGSASVLKKNTPTPTMTKTTPLTQTADFPNTESALEEIDEQKQQKQNDSSFNDRNNGDSASSQAACSPSKEQESSSPSASASPSTSCRESSDTSSPAASPSASADSSDSASSGSSSANAALSAEELVLGRFGYTKEKVITKTLQGNIFVAKHNKSKRQVVIKKTSKKLHNEHVTVQNGRKFGIYENILKECIILKYLTENKNGLIMTSFTKYDNFFDDDEHYYLSMEHGGSDLFDFIIEAHELIGKKKLKIKEWRKFTKYLFWQMIVVLKWLHNDMSICHLDISLENILCKNATFIPLNDDDSLYTINPNVQIKICDFGLAEIFHDYGNNENNENNHNNDGRNNDENDSSSNTKRNIFECKKYCGKTNYKSPQVYSKKKTFDARKADIWSLGVVLFCMLVGSPPYNKPIESDQAYLYIKSGIIDQLLFQWERNHFITVKVLSLLHCMLRYDEERRYLVEDVITHPWLSLYYNKYKTQMSKKSLLQQQKNKRCKPKLPYYKLPNSMKSVCNISQ